MKLAVIERGQEGSQTEKATEGDDIDHVEDPAVEFPEAFQVTGQGLVFHVRRLFGEKNHYRKRQQHHECGQAVDRLPAEVHGKPWSKKCRKRSATVTGAGDSHRKALVLLRKPTRSK